MNRKIGMIASLVNAVSVACFAAAMLVPFNSGSYFSSMFIAFSFLTMMCAYAYFSEEKTRLAGFISAVFSAVYATIILLVYFSQLTTVRNDTLTDQATSLLDFRSMGLMFNYDLLGYALMALSTFFAGLTVSGKTKEDKWLKGLLLVHGVFFISCLILPMLGVFNAGGEEWIGTAVLEFWCAYFIPIGILSYRRFKREKA